MEELEEAPPACVYFRFKRRRRITGLLYYLVVVLKELLEDKNKE